VPGNGKRYYVFVPGQTKGVTDSLLRLSIGLEDKDDLKQDLDNAMKKVSHYS
jgi:cystathionine beta-lyase/cystathionine gamma-synthase